MLGVDLHGGSGQTFLAYLAVFIYLIFILIVSFLVGATIGWIVGIIKSKSN